MCQYVAHLNDGSLVLEPGSRLAGVRLKSSTSREFYCETRSSPDVRCPSLKVLTPMSNYNLGCGSWRREFIYQQRTEPSRRIRRRVAGCCYRLIYTVNVGMRCEEPREAWTAPLNRSNRQWTCQPQRLDWLQIKKKNNKKKNTQPCDVFTFPSK